MKSSRLLLIIFAVIFFITFFYYLFTMNNILTKFRVTKDHIIKEPVNINYYELQNKYTFNNNNTNKNISCKKMCKENLCNEYHSQVIKYDLCKECKKERKCYDPLKGICAPCKNNFTCEQLFGCNNKPPVNPLNNLCTRCWIK